MLADGDLEYPPAEPLPADDAAVPGSPQAGPAPGKAAKARPAIRILADRMAAALVHHEPGWRLPRHTVLARRYHVSTDEIDAAIGELAARHIIRRLPDGQLYRASPAEYLIPLEGVTGFTHVDPMGGEIVCRSRHVSWRRVPEDIGYALGIAAGGSVCVVRSLWTASAEPAAVATTYLAAHIAQEPAGGQDITPLHPARTLPLLQIPEGVGSDQQSAAVAEYSPRAVSIEMQPPPPSIARSLQLSASQPATMITVRFDDPAQGSPAAVTVVVLRADLFRIVVETPAGPLPKGSAGGFPGNWTRAVAEPEP